MSWCSLFLASFLLPPCPRCWSIRPCPVKVSLFSHDPRKIVRPFFIVVAACGWRRRWKFFCCTTTQQNNQQQGEQRTSSCNTQKTRRRRRRNKKQATKGTQRMNNNNTAKHFVFTLLLCYHFTAVLSSNFSQSIFSATRPPPLISLPYYLTYTPHPTNLTYLTNASVNESTFR